ncbi:MAG: hypothetical protein DLM58_24580 [Pseudonocardiales bacterium]|nr:MAG: hypothetical protein DLM58_24580 [Pseudonocardiales bacterium]
MAFEEYDEGYPRAFAQLEAAIHDVLPGVAVEHVGSTSVPGLGGRRVLDVVILSRPDHDEKMRAALSTIGFTDFPYAHVLGNVGRLKPMLSGTARLEGGREYPVLLYLLPEDHDYVRGWIAWRQYMRQHPEEVERYAEVKRAVIASGQTDPRSYQQAKTPYLEELAKRLQP